MRVLYLIISCCISWTAYSQSSEEDFVERVQVHIDQHKPIDRIFTPINNYYKYCETSPCEQLDYIRFLELSYSWHLINSTTFLRLVKVYKKNHPKSIYTSQINQLVSLSKERDNVLKIYNTGVRTNELKEYHCSKYNAIGAFRQWCDYLDAPFKVIISDTTSTESSIIYQFRYEGHDYNAPNLKLLRGDGEDKINLLSNNSTKGSIQVKKGTFQEINFSVVSHPKKKTTIVFNSIHDEDSSLAFEPQIRLDDGIYIFNIKHAQPPFTLNFIEEETQNDFTFVYPKHKLLSAEDLGDLLDPGVYSLRMEDGHGNISKAFVVDIKDKTSSFPWGIVLGVLGFAVLFNLFYKWFKQRRPIRIAKRRNAIAPKPIVDNKTIEENKILDETPIPSQHSAEKKVKPQINVSNVKSGNSKNSLTKEELNQVINSEDYLLVNLKQLWSDTLVKKVYLKKEMIHRMDKDVRNEENMKKEIGGFLLGKFYKKPSGNYDIVLEEYIDIKGEGQSEFQIGFGADAWSKLEDSLNEYSQFDLIGWFHTHPGHGVFLSRPDKNISNNFFNKPYQVAMEIDPLLRPENPNLDTSFFTQKKNGGLNNNNDLLEQWHSWSRIVELS